MITETHQNNDIFTTNLFAFINYTVYPTPRTLVYFIEEEDLGRMMDSYFLYMKNLN